MTAQRKLGWQIMSACRKMLTMTVRIIHLSDLVYVTMFNVWTLIYILFICSEIVQYSTSDNASAECKDLPDVFTFDLYPCQTLTKLKKGDRLLSSILISIKTSNFLTKKKIIIAEKCLGCKRTPLFYYFSGAQHVTITGAPQTIILTIPSLYSLKHIQRTQLYW